MEILGFLSSILIGLSLGLIGGGGSILTVPVLVYFFKVDAVLATAYSLCIVGTTSLVGSITYFKQKLVNLRTAFVFGVPSIIAVIVTRIFVLPLIPTVVYSSDAFTVTKNMLVMILFAVLMVLASYQMIRKNNGEEILESGKDGHALGVLFIQGALVGIITGFIGAGGGFLIIPVLVNNLRVPMKEAIGTSLLIIAVNSLIGFVSSLPGIIVDWSFLIKIVLLAIVGVFVGTYVGRRIDGHRLKPAFGWFILIMGFYILAKELFF
ncbi:sulfite exporter TauE/SafE family protein [Sphingobacterium tabacisoli]|uniref:Probable membrane transporter protein n=1 Tax=Sphingobacterium tabacisoli TaxID=2044855 RepID=A0ABW5L7S3_9SPHI|nr:sulfite exporter TauE/SafE family protein [Sphingobacterium tabacisoli]